MPMPVAPIPISRPRQNGNKRTTRQELSHKYLIDRRAKLQVEKLSDRSKSIPTILRSLLILQKTSSVIVFILIAASLSIYSWIVYSQQLWTKEYKKLEDLQKDERQLTSTNETIKNKAAKEAEQAEFGLVPFTPDKNIFVPATVAPSSQQEQKSKTDNKEPLNPKPLAY